MNNVILIYGLPGVGKTTLMKGIVNVPGTERHNDGFVYHQRGRLIIPGDYEGDGDFLGTDRLSMNIQPVVTKFIKDRPAYDFIVEGDRLFNSKFIEAVNPIILLIEASPETIARRRAKRGSNQNPTFLKARQTKIDNIKAKYAYFLCPNEDDADPDFIRKNIYLLFGGQSSFVSINPNQLSMF